MEEGRLASGALAHPIVHPRPTLCARAKSAAGETVVGMASASVWVCLPLVHTLTHTDTHIHIHTRTGRARTRSNVHARTLHTHKRVPPHVYTARSVSERVGSRDVGGLLKFL